MFIICSPLLSVLAVALNEPNPIPGFISLLYPLMVHGSNYIILDTCLCRNFYLPDNLFFFFLLEFIHSLWDR